MYLSWCLPQFPSWPVIGLCASIAKETAQAEKGEKVPHPKEAGRPN